jgi:hypothetical protein
MNVIECEVEWDAEPEVLETLPDKVLVDLHAVKWTEESDDLEFEITEDNSSDIADYIAELYDQCVLSFNYRVIR